MCLNKALNKKDIAKEKSKLKKTKGDWRKKIKSKKASITKMWNAEHYGIVIERENVCNGNNKRKETTEVINMTNNFPTLCETPNPIFTENPAERTSNQFI